MDIQIIADTRSFDLLKEPWNELVQEADVFIFQTFEWNRTWWKYFGEGKKLNLILFYENDNLVGIAPLFWDTVQLLGIELYSCLRFIGSNVSQPAGEPLIGFIAYSDYLDLIAKPGKEEKVAQKLIQTLKSEIHEHSFDEILFEEVPPQSIILSHIISKLHENGNPLIIEDSSSCANILLDNSWDEYLAKMNSKERNKTRKYLKKLEHKDEKLLDVQITQNHSQLSDAYQTLVRIHQEQWNFKNFPGFFYERRMYKFMNEISRKFFDNGWTHIKELKAIDNNDCVGTYLYFKFKKRLYGIIGGMDHNSPLIHDGIGHIALTEALKEAIENDYEVFDFIRGLQNYKLKASDVITTNKTVMIKNPNLSSDRRVRFAKNWIKTLRRFRVEAIQFKLSFKNKGFGEGIKNYSLFISERIKHKRVALAS